MAAILVYFVERLPSPARSNIPQTVQSLLGKALPPQNHSIAVHRKLIRDIDSRLTGRRGHHDPTAQSHMLWSSMRREPLLKLLLLHDRRL